MTYRVRLMTLWTSCMMLCSANKCCRYLGRIVLKFYPTAILPKKKVKKPICGQPREGDGGSTEETEDGVWRRHPRPHLRLHLGVCKQSSLVFENLHHKSFYLLILYHCAIKDDQRYMSRSPIKVRGSVRIPFQTLDFLGFLKTRQPAETL